MKSTKNETAIVKGILLGSDWDPQGVITRFSLLASGEMEYEAICKKSHINLLEFLRANVEARGKISEKQVNGSAIRSLLINSIRKIERIEA